MKLHTLPRSLRFHTAIALASLALLGSACDPTDDGLDPAELLEDEDLDDEAPIETSLAARPEAPPEDARDAGKASAPGSLTTTSGPVAALGWIEAVSEETPPATCDGNGAAIWVDCMGSNCDDVQMFCGSHSGTPGTRSWTTWFSEEGTSWRICPGTEYVTGIACKGYWCDDVSIECTDLGLSAQSCWWSSYFKSNDPIFQAPSGHLIAGMQCKGAYCDEMRYFTCEV
ncbi:MAG: hypothetical protein AAF799_48090 [Myxococcota bacterium]